MPITLLEQHADINELCQWLDDNIIDEAIIPVADNLGLLTENKNVYLWFMNRECYLLLNKYFEFSSPELVFSKSFDGNIYDLVYAEGRWFRRDMENDPLGQRAEYHIAQTPATEADHANLLKSTLRSSITCLINDDLVVPDIYEEVNSILRKYFIVHRISYVEIMTSARQIIFQQAKMIVKKLNPLFNVRSANELEQLSEIYSSLNERRLNAAISSLDSLTREKNKANALSVETEESLSNYDQMKQAIYYWQGIEELDV